ncbi:gamma-glutamyltransferase family protein [Microbacterium oleivorans]|uniref:gamma-glutamyltransferase family protein n=1 Tax=Microbacterium oleivorans TaxID=273677 RepID=UPI000766E775|nr:gamma-glutamyltransferase [Microbacterium oleivorans]
MSGAVATSHYAATSAGERALRRGGNAIDAAIAAAAALCVVYQNNVALGGDLVALVRDPSGRIRFVNATGRAPRAQSLEALRERHGDALPDRGVDTVTVPGGVAGWGALHGLGGRLELADLLEDARLLAEESPVSRSTAAAIVIERDALAADPGCAALFLPGGEALGVGVPLRQPALARTLAELQRHGIDAFYRGDLADRWVAGLRGLGSLIDLDDTRDYRPVVTEPLTRRVFGLDLFTAGPNSQGFALLRNVLAVETAGHADPLGKDAAALAAAFRQSNAVRSAWLNDPDVGPHDGHDLIDIAAPEASGASAPPATGDTVGLVAVSDDGWAVSLVQSVYWAFGACVLEPETGILFQNRGTSFSLDADHPAAFGPGRRPPHTLMPVLVERDGELLYAAATMGGQAQAQIHSHLLLRLRHGASAIEATSAPRWVVGIQDDGDAENSVIIEADVPREVREALSAGDLRPRVVPPRDEALGHSNLIVATETGWDAASDPRSDGSAVIIEAAR